MQAPIAVFVAAFMLVTSTAWAFEHERRRPTRRSARSGSSRARWDGGFQYTSERESPSAQALAPSRPEEGLPKVEITVALPQNEAAVHVGVFIDRGEPGITLDIGRMRWSREWPVTPANTVRKDFGRIDAGNVQIL
jgi:hypothetical protein